MDTINSTILELMNHGSSKREITKILNSKGIKNNLGKRWRFHAVDQRVRRLTKSNGHTKPYTAAHTITENTPKPKPEFTFLRQLINMPVSDERKIQAIRIIIGE